MAAIGTRIAGDVDVQGLTDRQSFALLHRLLWREGFDDRIAGHMTMRCDDGETLYASPYGACWDEVRASDVLRISRTGELLEGQWPVSTSITLHLVVHEERPDALVAVHHHPEWSTVWAAARRVPPIYDQLSAFVPDDLVLYDEYEGGVNELDLARANVRSMGGSSSAILANHGVLVLARSVEEAHLRCVSVEHRCKLAWRVEALGGGAPLRPDVARKLSDTISAKGGWPQFFDAMVRHEVRKDPSVLS